jgi:hypothetical protein
MSVPYELRHWGSDVAGIIITEVIFGLNSQANVDASGGVAPSQRSKRAAAGCQTDRRLRIHCWVSRESGKSEFILEHTARVCYSANHAKGSAVVEVIVDIDARTPR